MQLSSLFFASLVVLAIAKDHDSESTTDLAQAGTVTEIATSTRNKRPKATGEAAIHSGNSTGSETPGSGSGVKNPNSLATATASSGGRKSGNSTKTRGAGSAAPTGSGGSAKNGSATSVPRPIQTGGAVAILAQGGGFVTVAGLGVVFAVFM